MHIFWLGHSCFKLCNRKYSVVIDPYENGSVPGVPDLKATASAVLCSHGHRDHDWEQGVEILTPKGAPFKVEAIESYHDGEKGKVRGRNTIHVIHADGVRMVHMGDQGDIPTDEQFEIIGRPDVLMIPVGGYYTIDAVTAKKIADRCGARVVVPMHYRGDGFGYDVLATAEDFTRLYPQNEVKYYDGDTLEVTEDTLPHVAVLKFKR